MPESVSSFDLARRVLAACVSGQEPSAEDADALTRRAASEQQAEDTAQALIGVLAEGLSDRFEPALCHVYARLFARFFAAADPGLSAGALVERYSRIRQPGERPWPDQVRRVVVLSRVTLGADIAISSQFLAAALARFPGARVLLAGGMKNWQLFAGHPKVGHLPVSYPRRSGSLADRAAFARQLAATLTAPGTLVLDPDSRLSQLGLLPVCPESRYRFFESRAAGGGGGSLYELAREWLAETMGVPGEPFLAPAPSDPPDFDPSGAITVSFGVGENPAKRLPAAAETRLLAGLAERAPVVVDLGGGGEESERVRQAHASLAPSLAARVRLWQGSFAAFAQLIGRSRFYAGYDSAGQHAAAVSGVPFVVIFAGFPNTTFLRRWTPAGKGPGTVVTAARDGEAEAVAEALAAADLLL